MKKKVVVDRFEGEMAVLLMDEKPLNVLRNKLPKGIKEGDWLNVEFDGENIISAEIDKEEKEQMKARIDDKLAQLRQRKGGEEQEED
jgi:hypothetical protein